MVCANAATAIFFANIAVTVKQILLLLFVKYVSDTICNVAAIACKHHCCYVKMLMLLCISVYVTVRKHCWSCLKRTC